MSVEREMVEGSLMEWEGGTSVATPSPSEGSLQADARSWPFVWRSLSGLSGAG